MRKKNETENKSSVIDIDYDSNGEPSIFEEEESDTGTKKDVSRLTGSLLPPPLVSYPTYESLRVAIRAWTKEQGYDLVVKQTKSFNSKIVRRFLECGRAGKTQNKHKITEENRVRKTSSHKTNCQMGIWLVADDRQNPEGSWSTKYKSSEQANKHNHGPEFGITNHRRHDRDGEFLNGIHSHIRTGVTTAQSMAILRLKFPTLVQSKSDISNVKTKFRQETLKSMTPMAAVLLRLQKNSFFTRYTVDGDNHLHQLFLAHPKSIELYRKFSEVLILDCTYKTNRYRKPLLNICGVTGSNRTIQVALCLMASETTEAYTWALESLRNLLREERIETPKLVVTDRDRAFLNAIGYIFPTVNSRICMWHMHKDVHTWIRQRLGLVEVPNSRDYIDSEETKEYWDLYKKTVDASTVEEFKTGCQRLEAKWEEGWRYLWNTWFRDYTEKFASYEMNKILHFGISSTSRVEGNHSKLKKWLQNSRCDVYGLVEKLIPWWEDYYSSINLHLEDEKRQIPLANQTPILEQVNLRIFRYPINLLEYQMKKARKEVERIARCQSRGEKIVLEPCSNVFGTTLGLPCAHRLRDILLEGKSLSVSDFHRHWHIENDVLDTSSRILPILEPRTALTRKDNCKLKKKGTGKYGNRRDILHAEKVLKRGTFGISRNTEVFQDSVEFLEQTETSRHEEKLQSSIVRHSLSNSSNLPLIDDRLFHSRPARAYSYSPNKSFKSPWQPLP